MTTDQEKTTLDIPVKIFIRVTRTEPEPKERALFVAIDEKGREYVLMYEDFNRELNDLTVCDNIKVD